MEMDLSNFTCPNDRCSDFGRSNAGNIALYTEYGKKQVRLLICHACHKTFSELKGTPFWDSRLDWEGIEWIYLQLLNGKSIHATERASRIESEGRSKNTIKRYWKFPGKSQEAFQKFIDLCKRFFDLDLDPLLLYQRLLYLEELPWAKRGTYLNSSITEEWIEETFSSTAR